MMKIALTSGFIAFLSCSIAVQVPSDVPTPSELQTVRSRIDAALNPFQLAALRGTEIGSEDLYR